jgi:hypothetical protein
VASEAVAAVYTASSGNRQQDATCIFAHDARNRHAAVFSQGIRGIARYVVQLGRNRKDLKQQRVSGVALAHARNVTSRNAQRNLVVGGGISADLLRLELQEP